MNAPNRSGNYANMRFAWKKALSKDPYLSGGAKLLAVLLCDTYVNKNTGLFWPKNETMAQDLSKSVRTVQRHLRELEDVGYIRMVKKPRKRRVYEICFSKDHKGDTEHDTSHDKDRLAGLPPLSPEHDTNVTPYKNQVYNKHGNETSHTSRLAYLKVEASEKASLEAWREWFDKNQPELANTVWNLLRNGSGYQLPCRYPEPGCDKQYLGFFDAVTRSEGKCFLR
jgi:DNA-binding transcriptional ArsR family regulator